MTDQARIITLPKICDPRGNLSVIESYAQVPFEIKRAYWIHDIPGGKYRNGHAFRTQSELMVALSGSFTVVTCSANGLAEERFTLSQASCGLYLPPMTWRSIEDFSTNALVLVISSGEYNPLEYIRDFNLFKQLAK
ncbi:MAG: sugar 3,4-ketoisomerase [Muribaculaceae bacterium]